MKPRMTRRQIEDRVRELPWPAPSASLRERVMVTAVVTPHTITWSDRVWFSRAWRCAAVGAALAIVVLDQLSGAPQRPGFTASAQAIAEAQSIEETGRQVGLPPDVAASLGRRVLLPPSRVQPPPESASSLLQSFETGDSGGTR